MSDGNGGLLGRLRDWLGSLFGHDADGGAATEGTAGTCAVCGTRVEDPGSGCPLCGSTDVETAADGDASGDESPPEPERESRAGTADDDAARLRDVRGGTAADDRDGGSAGGRAGAAAGEDGGRGGPDTGDAGTDGDRPGDGA